VYGNHSAFSSCAATKEHNKQKTFGHSRAGKLRCWRQGHPPARELTTLTILLRWTDINGDHAYVFYQIPVKARKITPDILARAGQFSKTWETHRTGREGFQKLFLRRGFAVYL